MYVSHFVVILGYIVTWFHELFLDACTRRPSASKSSFDFRTCAEWTLTMDIDKLLATRQVGNFSCQVSRFKVAIYHCRAKFTNPANTTANTWRWDCLSCLNRGWVRELPFVSRDLLLVWRPSFDQIGYERLLPATTLFGVLQQILWAQYYSLPLLQCELGPI